MAHELHAPKVKIVTGPPEGGSLRELWARLRRPFVAVFRNLRTRWLLHRGITHARRWWNPFWTTVVIFILAVLTLALVLWGLRGLLIIIHHPVGSWWGFDPDDACKSNGTSCAAVTSAVMPVFLLASSTVLFLVWRLWRVRRFCARQARTEPGRFVQTAGSLMDEVVGRDQLCNAIMNNLRDRRARRPHVVVGKVGAGKTAVLVRLAEKLAAEGAVPVPVRLCDAQEELDFCELARKRFRAMVQPIVRSDAEVDRIWRWLRQRADRIVVLADGLEEALNHDDQVSGERDNLIREAIRRAGEEGLPLVIASRPHDPLRAMQAAVSELEPLSDEASLRYIARSGSWRSDATLLDRVVEVANMAESPLYLQIAKDLHSKELLEALWAGGGTADPLLHDSWALRADLLERWIDALVDGEIHPELPIDHDMRLAVVEYLSALACIGLASDRGDVGLCELDPSVGTGRNGEPGTGGKKARMPAGGEWNERVVKTLDEHMSKLQQPRKPRTPDCGPGGGSPRPSDSPQNGCEARIDVRLAATWGTRMGLVQERGEKVQFQHSIMQAYLGSRFLPNVLDSTPVRDASGDTPPGQKKAEHRLTTALRQGGRELLIALTLHSRSLEGRCNGAVCRADGSATCPVVIMRELLTMQATALLNEAEEAREMQYRSGYRREADSSVGGVVDDRGSLRLRAIEIYGAAVEIDSVETVQAQDGLIRAIKDDWERFGRGEDPARLREAKLTLVKQCGAAERRVAADQSCNPAYRELFAIGCRELDYRVRAGIAQEIGAGGEQAYLAVDSCGAKGALDNCLRAPKLDAIDTREHDQHGCDAEKNFDGAQRGTDADGEQTERVHRALRREQVRKQEREERKKAEEEVLEEKQRWYGDTMRAWVLPMLVDSAMMTRHRGTPRDDLENWVRAATGEADSPASEAPPGTSSGLGVALAQGFKYAANRRPSLRSDRQAREFLVKHAEEMLKRSTLWYTRLTLLHALTLWALPDDVNEDQPIRGHGADPRGQVQEWLTLGEGRQKEHPLVEAAGELAVRALQTRRPERFLWIDEAGVASGVGAEVGVLGEQRAHNLWIPQSTGWSTLDPMAQQLLADVLLLLVLGERGYRPKDLFRFLDLASRERTQIPSCMSRDRTRLDPVRGVERTLQPGSNCTDECRLRMCPYPAKVENLRLEFSEVFCLHQRDLLRRWRPRAWLCLQFRREAPWQRKVPVAGMRRFWGQMGDRAWDANPDGADAARRRVGS
ncbi:NACHT domain-containing protein [Streptomyces sp. H27-D2]|uniref:NACHT domain-containing protein n=1 Tax=Streptomyces sp. H27-D2 TaxID=3046304 RepID=UPI002DBA513B|nr:NACHT domain-containing protein [Streptomyces sp. H27-D2]MEC4017892.1 NACHT domain-containing protein [Streptomyces sp. H27-D2]